MDDRDMELTGGWPQMAGQFENPGHGYSSCNCTKCMREHGGLKRVTQRLPTKTIEERRQDMFLEHEANFGAGTWPFYKRESMTDLAAPSINSFFADSNNVMMFLFFLVVCLVIYQLKVIADLRVAVATVTGKP
jgi:hypothetical protein